MAASSSITSSTITGSKYDVFLSFRGKDTRDNFTSHLHDELRKKKIQIFMDNTKLRKGEEISPSLLKAIEESKLFVIILSKNYAYSKWCLDELLKMLDCKKVYGQSVIPVFYGVDPSHVRKQKGRFGDALARHERLFKDQLGKVHSWRAALTEVANLSGWDSRIIRPESVLVKEIVTDILDKLYQTISTSCAGLVGIDSCIQKIVSLLSMPSPSVRIIGIWGMGGIGKTTLAGAVYGRIHTQFKRHYFLANIKEELKRSTVIDLRNKLCSAIVEDNISVCTPTLPTFLVDRLHFKNVLVVLDDVDDSVDLQELLGGQRGLFGLGCKILITSRDKQVLKHVVDEIYEVEGLKHDDALRLFSLNAFNKSHPPSDDHTELSMKVVRYANGNALALKVLGSSLFDRTREYWLSALEKLGKVPNPRLQIVLKMSYDELDGEQQNILLDIACFLRGEKLDHAIEFLKGCYCFVCLNVHTLIDKCLVTVSNNKLEMHDLIHEMACGIVRAESIKEPGKRSRLWDPDDILDVLTKKKGTSTVEVIFHDVSKTREMHLEFDAFDGMDRLRWLKFFVPDVSIGCNYKVYLPHGLQCLSDELRYLHWHRFPLKSLPSNFCAEHLVEINLPYSKVKKLWKGVQHLVNLKRVDLKYSKYLVKIPDLSKAVNLKSIDLEGCKSLVKLPSSIQYLNKLEFLTLISCDDLASLPTSINSKFLKLFNLSFCFRVTNCPEISGNLEVLDLSGTTIKELPPSIHELEALKILDLSGCSSITKFPEISKNIRVLILTETAIEEVPSSIEFLAELVTLDMSYCERLLSLPNTICKLKSLGTLDLTLCSKLESFPEILEPMENLWYLYLSGTAIKEIPSSVENLVCLRLLKIDGCQSLRSLPNSIRNLRNLWELGASETKGLRFY